MSLADKELCARCGHPRYVHTGNHLAGHRTICRKELPRGARCACLVFVEAPRAVR